MKQILLVLIIVLSCKSSTKSPSIEQITKEQYPKPIIDSLKPIADSLPSSNSIAKEEPRHPAPPTVFELETFAKVNKANSPARFLSQFFIIGSTASQLRKVQGRPNDIIKTADYTEVWLYGNCEVTVYNTIVSKIENSEGCLNYIDAEVCLDSGDKKVRQIIIGVIEIQSKSIRY